MTNPEQTTPLDVANTVNTRIQQAFAPAASAYTTSSVHAQGRDLAWIAEALHLTGQERILDVGCGAGHAAFAVAPGAREVVALDLTPAMLDEVARNATARSLSNIVTQVAPVTALPFPDASFDHVISRLSAHHWASPVDGLREIVRVLKPGGLFILSDTIGFPEPVQDTFLQTIELLRDGSHVRDYTEREWIAMITEAAGDALDSVSCLQTWDIDIDFDSWVARISTPPARITVLRELFSQLPAARMKVQLNHDFVLLKGLFRAVKKG